MASSESEPSWRASGERPEEPTYRPLSRGAKWVVRALVLRALVDWWPFSREEFVNGRRLVETTDRPGLGRFVGLQFFVYSGRGAATSGWTTSQYASFPLPSRLAKPRA